MTLEEFSNEFDILLGLQLNISIEAEVNEYEKSLFLTKAQEILFNELYSAYDKMEYSKRALNPLVFTYEAPSGTFVYKTDSISLEDFKSYSIAIPDELLYITNEQLLDINNNSVDIKPVKVDFYNNLKKNPFKKPNSNKCWRTEFSGEYNGIPSDNNKNSHLEIITSLGISEINKYICTYIMYPTPIILEDLVGDFSIRGVSVATEAILNNITHEDILNKAVMLASASLQNSAS